MERASTPPSQCDLPCSPRRYWELRDDQGYCAYVALHADPPSEIEVLSRTESGDGEVKRITKIKALRNPVPYLLQKTLGVRDGFALVATETWNRKKAGARATITIALPIFTDAINVSGTQWVEARGASPLSSSAVRSIASLTRSATTGMLTALGARDEKRAGAKERGNSYRGDHAVGVDVRAPSG